MVVVNAFRSREYKGFLDRQAMKLNGSVKIFPLNYPRLFFPAEDQVAELRLKAKTKHSQAQTSLCCRIPGLAEYRLVLERGGMDNLFSKISQAIENHVPEISLFERNFDVFSNNQPITQVFIQNPEFQKALFAMLENNPKVKISRGKFCLSIDGILKSDLAYDRFINNGKIIIQKIIQESRFRA
jgi:hypothetical protein